VSTLPNHRLLVDAQIDNIYWVMDRDGELIAHGIVTEFSAVNGVAARAGLFDVQIIARRRRLEAAAYAKRYGWTFIQDQAAALAIESIIHPAPPRAA